MSRHTRPTTVVSQPPRLSIVAGVRAAAAAARPPAPRPRRRPASRASGRPPPAAAPARPRTARRQQVALFTQITFRGGCRHDDDAPRPGKVTRMGGLVLVGGDRRAAADEVAVAVRAVDAADRRPVLAVCAGWRPGTRRARARTGGPTCRAVSMTAVCGALRSGLSAASHSPDATRSISALIAIIASTNRSSSARSSRLGRLDHQRARDRERHRRRVEPVVDQPLGHVVHGHAGRLGDRPQVEDALVGDEPALRRCRAPGSAARSRRAT